MVRSAVSFVRRVMWEGTLGHASYAVGLLRRRPDYIEERWEGTAVTPVGKVAVFVHYDLGGVVHDYVLHYLRQLRQAGFRILFVSNAPSLPAESRAALTALCALIVRRRNVGYDFGAFKDGIGLLGNLEAVDELLLVNDSVYGPFFDLKTVLANADPQKAAVWSITDSWERRYHLQSYFLLFRGKALRHPAFAAFWRNVRYVQSKTWVVQKYEVGLSRAMLRAGLRCAALYPYRRAAMGVTEAVRLGGALSLETLDDCRRRYLVMLYDRVSRGVPLNTSHFFWDYLIGEMGCPFLKRELLQKNPADIPYVDCWETVIRRNSDYDTDLILKHLEVSLRDRCA